MITQYSRKHFFLLVAVIIVLLIAVPYLLGFRVGPDLHIERVGTLMLTNLPSGTSVYIDDTLYRTLGSAGNVSEELEGGSHSIIVSAPGDYPWSSITQITSNKDTTIEPLLVSTKPNVTKLSGTAETQALAAIASTTLPTQAHPLVMGNGCEDVYVSNNQIIAAAVQAAGCTPPPYLCVDATCSPTIIYAPIAPLKTVVAFPKRQDALVFQFGSTLFAISLDPRSPQFFAPLLIGTNPVMGALPDGTIVVENGSVVFRVNL
jgi:hypothetical protein